MSGIYDTLITAQYAITALSSGLNTCYFMAYRSPRKRRRVGAVAMVIINLAICIESTYFGLFSFFKGLPWSAAFFLDPERWFLAGLLLCVASVLISILILRQWCARRRGCRRRRKCQS